MSTSFNWSSPVTLSTTSINSSDPQIAVDMNGNNVAVWVENGIIKASVMPFNMNWGTPVTLSNPGASSPRVVSDPNGNITVIWLRATIVYAVSKPANGNWGTATALSNSGASVPCIAVDSLGDVIAGWARNGNIETATKLFGSSWQNRVIIASTSATYPNIAISASATNIRAVLVWHSTSTNLVYAVTKLIDSSWSTSQIISNTGINAAYAHAAVDMSGNAVVIWYAYNLNGSNYSNVKVHSAYYTSNIGWSTSVHISDAGIKNPADLVARINVDASGNALAAWTTSYDGSTFDIQSAIKPIGANWAPATEILNNLYSMAFDMSTTSFGDTLMAYMLSNGSSLSIQSIEEAISGIPSASWSSATNVVVGNNNGFPRIAFSYIGNNLTATIVWIRSNGSNNVISAVNGLRYVIMPPSNLSVAQYTNNFGVLTEYYNTLTWNASSDPNVNGYVIFRNGKFIQQVASNVLSYVDDNQTQNGAVTYGVAAVNSQQSQSNIISVNFL